MRKNTAPDVLPMPRSIDDEHAVIGGCIIADHGSSKDKSMIGYALSHLTSDDFSSERAKIAFRAIERLHSIKLKNPAFLIDITVVVSLLRRHNKLSDCTPAFLCACVESCPSVANMAAYVENVRECSMQRKMIYLAERMTRVLTLERDREFHAGDIINTTRKTLDAIEAGKTVDFTTMFTVAK